MSYNIKSQIRQFKLFDGTKRALMQRLAHERFRFITEKTAAFLEQIRHVILHNQI